MAIIPNSYIGTVLYIILHTDSYVDSEATRKFIRQDVPTQWHPRITYTLEQPGPYNRTSGSSVTDDVS